MTTRFIYGILMLMFLVPSMLFSYAALDASIEIQLVVVGMVAVMAIQTTIGIKIAAGSRLRASSEGGANE